MKNLILAALLMGSALGAQKLQPVVGIHWTGGWSYEMEHELPSAELGILYSPKKSILTNVQLTGNFYYDFLPEKINSEHTFYLVKVQAAKEFAEFWNVAGYVGYTNAFDGNIMRHYDGDFKTNLAYGFGVQTTDDHITAEILFESIAGYPQLSIGVTYKFNNLLRKNENQKY